MTNMILFFFTLEYLKHFVLPLIKAASQVKVTFEPLEGAVCSTMTLNFCGLLH